MIDRNAPQPLYRQIQEVESLEKKIKSVPFEKQAKIKDQLRKTKAERDHMHAILEGKKDHQHK